MRKLWPDETSGLATDYYDEKWKEDPQSTGNLIVFLVLQVWNKEGSMTVNMQPSSGEDRCAAPAQPQMVRGGPHEKRGHRMCLLTQTPDPRTYQHPDGKPDPSALVQLHHEIDVHENAQDGEHRQEGHLQGQEVGSDLTECPP